MPLYEYRCATCGKDFEVVQSMSEDSLSTCSVELCVSNKKAQRGTGEVRRMLFAPAIHFKGTGFHNTDYGSRRRGGEGDSASNGAGGDSSGNGGDSAGSTTTTESVGKATPAESGSSKKTVGLNDV